MPAIASLDDLKVAQRDLLETKRLEELEVVIKKWRHVGWKMYVNFGFKNEPLNS